MTCVTLKKIYAVIVNYKTSLENRITCTETVDKIYENLTAVPKIYVQR